MSLILRTDVSYNKLEGETSLIIGGYESGIDAAWYISQI